MWEEKEEDEDLLKGIFYRRQHPRVPAGSGILTLVAITPYIVVFGGGGAAAEAATAQHLTKLPHALDLARLFTEPSHWYMTRFTVSLSPVNRSPAS